MRLPLIRSASDTPQPRRAADPFARGVRPRSNGLPHWHESSLDLQRGLEVVEVFNPQDAPDVHAR